MAQLLLTTTGTLSPVPLDDLGIIGIVHPKVDLVMWDSADNSPFEFDEVKESQSIQEAIDSGYITLKDDLGNSITDIFRDFPLFLDNNDWDDNTGTADEIPFNIAYTKPAHSEGLFYYDKDEHAFVGFNDEPEITQQIGREFYRRVRNETGATITNGQVVYQSGAETGGEGRALIDLAQANNPTTENVIGVATHDIENNSYGYITVLGDVNDVNTNGLTAGQILYLSPTVAGGLQTALPEEDEFVVEVVTVEKVDASTGRYNVNIKNRGRLTDFNSIGGLSYWQVGLSVVESSPEDQTVDYTSGSYIINGVQYSVASNGTFDFQSPTDYYATMTNYQHRLVILYADDSGTIKAVAGPIAEKNDLASLPALPADSLCISIVELNVNSGGSPKDIKDNYHIADCRQGANLPTNGNLIKISPDDTNESYLEDALTSNGNVTFTKENTGANETLKADVSDASTTVKGIVERATQAEVDSGTDTTRYITPATLASATSISTSISASDVITDSPVGDKNNYNPSGFTADTKVIRVSPDNNNDLTGLVYKKDWQEVIIVNFSSINKSFKIKPNNANSSAANRISGDADIALLPGHSIRLIYDGITNIWRPQIPLI